MGYSQAVKLLSCDEVGSRVLGFTVHDTDEGSVSLVGVADADSLAGDPDVVWASPIELLVWLSRTPAYWGKLATSATFRVWDRARGAVETTIARASIQAQGVIDRWDLV
jgi:hypothetical protein